MVLDHSTIILVVNVPEMEMELLLQTQGNLLTRFLNLMRKWLEVKEDKDTTCGSDTNPTDYLSSESQENQKDSRLATASS